MSATLPKPSGSYHHGDLYNSLIAAAAELIQESGSMDFAMVDAARRAGVSSAAPYRHFRDKDALLEAVCELAFVGLNEAVMEALQGQRAGSMEAIVAIGHAYRGFVSGKPAFYDLMWGDHGFRAMDEEGLSHKAIGFHLLVENLHIYLSEHDIRHIDALNVAGRLWALVHGMSSLTLHNQMQKFLPDVDACAMLEDTTRALLLGLEAQR
ncbi:MAG: TetR/AcrR family transcriptional regulator [Pseudomonadota bacterium]